MAGGGATDVNARVLLGALLIAAAVAGEPADATGARIAAAAQAQVGITLAYDPAYVRLAYPGGDVPASTGVCADVVVRALRAVGVDLQQAVHDDMAAHFAAYPRLWDLKRPDPHIDHRRVANLQTYFARAGKGLAISATPADYRVGDVVAWQLGGGRLHIGVVAEGRSADGQRPLVVHNIGQGAQREDVLFGWPVIGWYRW